MAITNVVVATQQPLYPGLHHSHLPFSWKYYDVPLAYSKKDGIMGKWKGTLRIMGFKKRGGCGNLGEPTIYITGLTLITFRKVFFFQFQFNFILIEVEFSKHTIILKYMVEAGVVTQY